MARQEARPRHITVTRYVDSAGRRCPKGTPGAAAVRETSSTYFAWVGGARVPLRTADLGCAWKELRRLQRRAADRRRGLRDDLSDQQERPLDEHVDDWLQAVRDKGTSAEQCDLLGSRVRHLASLAGWTRLTDLDTDSALRALATLTAPAPEGEGRSAQTRNHYVRAVKQLARWASGRKPRRLAEDPLSDLDTVSVEADRRHDRRCPEAEEVATLFAHLASEQARRA